DRPRHQPAGAPSEGLGVRHEPELPVARHAGDLAQRRDPRRHADGAPAGHAGGAARGLDPGRSREARAVDRRRVVSRYAWPRAARGGELEDDPRGRAAFLHPRRTDFDPDGARTAGRQPLMLPVVPGGLAAPASGRSKLWQPLGPLTLIRGQATGTPRIAGRVNALAVPSDGQRAYAASGNGGIWYSSDGGASWRSLGGFAPTNTPE